MKTFAIIAKILAALATIAGIVYVIATYGDKIVAWAKDMLAKFGCCHCDCCDCECEEEAEEETEEPAAEEAAEEAPAAEENDFEG